MDVCQIRAENRRFSEKVLILRWVGTAIRWEVGLLPSLLSVFFFLGGGLRVSLKVSYMKEQNQHFHEEFLSLGRLLLLPDLEWCVTTSSIWVFVCVCVSECVLCVCACV